MQSLVLVERGTIAHDFQQRTIVQEDSDVWSDFQKCVLLLVRNSGNPILNIHSLHRHISCAFYLFHLKTTGPGAYQSYIGVFYVPTETSHTWPSELEPDSF